MFSTIVVGFDASAQAHDALVLAQTLASPSTEIVVCCVHPPEMPDLASEDSLALQADERLSAARGRLGDRPNTRFHVRGSFSAGAGLHDEAERAGADLLIVGSSHRSTLGRIIPGSVTRQVLHAAPCAVAVAPAGLHDHEPALQHIGVAFNDRPESQQALGTAARLAREHGADLTLITVVDVVAVADGWAGAWVSPAVRDDMRAGAEDEGRKAIATVEGVEARVEVISGMTGQELVLASTRFDLLVMGSRGYGPIRRALLGTTSGRVAEAAACPVLITPRGSTGPGRPSTQPPNPSEAPAMSETILVGVDRDGARDAVALGGALAAALGGELAIVHVYPFDPLAGSIALGAPPDVPLEQEARDIVARAGEGCPMPYRPVVVSHTSTVGGLHDEAQRTGAALLVVGSSHRGTLRRIALGSNSERVLQGAPCAVAVAPHALADAGWQPRRIAVGYDGSEDAAHAVATARRIARAVGGTLQLVTVVESAPGGSERSNDRPDWHAHEAELVEAAEQALADVAAEGEQTDVRVGDAVEQLRMLSFGTDLLVLGSRGYGPVRRVLEGATAHRVVREADCPVVVVPGTRLLQG